MQKLTTLTRFFCISFFYLSLSLGFSLALSLGLSLGVTHHISASPLPASARSERAIAKVTPSLSRQLKQKDLSIGNAVYIRIFKDPSALELWIKNKEQTFTLFKQYPICRYSGQLGPKLKTGDMQSPEGFYFVKANQFNPWSQFHLSINIGYPNAYDRFHGRTGNYLMIHGDCVSIGCYAMTDAMIEEIYALTHHAIKNGQPFFRVHIFPFPLTPDNLNKHREHHDFNFWLGLKDGYDFFESHNIPPNILVKEGKYIVDSQSHTQE